MSKRILVCGAGGFIGGHMVQQLKKEGNFVIGVDIKKPEFRKLDCDEFLVRDLRDFSSCMEVTRNIDEVYQFAADMGGAGYVFTGEHDDDILHNSATINLSMAEACKRNGVKKIFYSSSACIYPESKQMDENNTGLKELDAYPAGPDSEYGWEKLFSERLWQTYSRARHFEVRICRYHNIFGPYGTWRGGKEKAPAAMIRKVLEADDKIDVWGDGKQTRSFLYIDDCIRMSRQLMDSNISVPLNIGSEEIISINDLAKMAIEISNKAVTINNISGPIGVRGRNSNNDLYVELIGNGPEISLRSGMEKTFEWIQEVMNK